MTRSSPPKQSNKSAHPAHPAQPPKNPAKSQGKPKEVEPDEHKPEKEDETSSVNKESHAAKGKHASSADEDDSSGKKEEDDVEDGRSD